MSNNETPVILAPRFPSALTEIYEQRKRNAQLKALLSESLKYVYERSSKRGMHVPLLVSKQDADEFLDRIRAALAPEAAERGYTSTATTMPKQCTPADAAAMQAVIKALEDEKAARKAPQPTASEGETYSCTDSIDVPEGDGK